MQAVHGSKLYVSWECLFTAYMVPQDPHAWFGGEPMVATVGPMGPILGGSSMA